MNFIAFDFETTGGKNQRPCSLGITVIEDNQIVNEYYSLINPEIKISPSATKIHGITNKDVKDAPLFPVVWKEVISLFNKYGIAFAHNVSFDKKVLFDALLHYNLEFPKCLFLCSFRYCQDSYPNLPKHNLDYLCKFFNLNAKCTHNSLDDSRAVAKLILKMLDNESIFNAKACVCVPEVEGKEQEEDGVLPTLEYQKCDCIDFKDKSFVATGDLVEMSRSDLQQFIVSQGGKLKSGVSSKTDYLIVGLEDLTAVKDKQSAKSNKIKEAEELIAKGKPIKIIKGSDFLSIVKRCISDE
ncbi:MAG: hypothetical protein IJ447_01940 [Clostridia bacterium]|nr:hypothetical protein [Clostridia bacterium]